MNKLFNISQLSKKLKLVNPDTKRPLNHIVRYWEKEFKQIKPKIINKHRYYNNKQLETFKLIKFLLKDKGMTIKGVKNILNSDARLIDYKVDSITKGSDSTAEIVTIVNDGHNLKQGRAVSTDVVQGSVESFLNALNK